jgi:hypothetical protein
MNDESGGTCKELDVAYFTVSYGLRCDRLEAKNTARKFK